MAKPYGRIYQNKQNVSIMGIDTYDVWPVGSIFMTTNPTHPKDLFGGEWEEILGRFLVGRLRPSANNDGYFGAVSGIQYNIQPGSTGGQDFHTLSISEMPSHNHSTLWKFSGGQNSAYAISWTNGNWQGHYENALGAFSMSNTGGGGAHNNMPPYYGVYMWRRIR